MVKGLVLASGYGLRLRKYFNKPKYFIDIWGYPLIYYPLYCLKHAGIKDIYIIVNREVEKHIYKLNDILEEFNVSIILNPYPELDNGYTLLYGLDKIDDEWIIVSVSDHIYPPNIVMKIKENINNTGDFYIAGDPDPIYVDEVEATKILTDDDNKVLKVGKELTTYKYVDMGIFLFSKRIFRYIDLDSKPKLTISQLINSIINSGSKGYVEVFKNVEWKDVDTLDDLKFVRSSYFKKLLGKYFEWLKEV